MKRVFLLIAALLALPGVLAMDHIGAYYHYPVGYPGDYGYGAWYGGHTTWGYSTPLPCAYCNVRTPIMWQSNCNYEPRTVRPWAKNPYVGISIGHWRTY